MLTMSLRAAVRVFTLPRLILSLCFMTKVVFPSTKLEHVDGLSSYVRMKLQQPFPAIDYVANSHLTMSCTATYSFLPLSSAFPSNLNEKQWSGYRRAGPPQYMSTIRVYAAMHVGLTNVLKWRPEPPPTRIPSPS